LRQVKAIGGARADDPRRETAAAPAHSESEAPCSPRIESGVDAAGNFRLARAARGVAKSAHDDPAMFLCLVMGSACDISSLRRGALGPLAQKGNSFAAHLEVYAAYLRRAAPRRRARVTRCRLSVS
jgi:hypothetical protein